MDNTKQQITPDSLQWYTGLVVHSHPVMTCFRYFFLEMWEINASFLFCGKRSKMCFTFIGLIRIKYN